MSVFNDVKSKTRHTIIRTASDLFYEKGYNLTGINEIIEESGIAKATLYSHFRSKEELLLAYLDEKDQELLKSIKAFCASKPAGDEQLIAVLEFLIPFFEQEDFNGCWCIRSIAEVPRENVKVRTKIKSNKQAFRQFVLELVKSNKPELDEGQQQQLGNQLYLLYEGALTESHIQGAAWPIETSINLLKDKLKTI
ncbi:MAG: TetR/AcrR family transcriptional regulator [Saprospiraceae bacterium]|nr:TetR/AcrR family transcriptional regulator [Saprospiraceae bacterium]